MKGLFPQFDPVSQNGAAEMWKDAVLVFDTNVLLNLYRYKSSTREELLHVLSSVRDRIWIPYQVALEFQRNRLGVIGQLRNRFAEARNLVSTTRSKLRGDLAEEFSSLASEFLKVVEKHEAAVQDIRKPDPLKEQVETLFEGRVGDPPLDQKEIDRLQSEAETRSKHGIPPGFVDAKKKEGICWSGGFLYQNKYGDYLVWRQLLARAKAAGWKTVIFVTDDAKEDWWWKVESLGEKTMGPLPELVEEARLEGGIESFFMYDSESFLNLAGENLKEQVSKETLDDVRDVSQETMPSHSVFQREISIHLAIEEWLVPQFESVDFALVPFDYECSRNGESWAVETLDIRNGVLALGAISKRLQALHDAIEQEMYSRGMLVAVCVDQKSALLIKKRMIGADLFARFSNVSHLAVGVIHENSFREVFSFTR